MAPARLAPESALCASCTCVSAPQYLGFPAAAGEPPLQLKGFVKTAVLPSGGAAVVTFPLRPRDTSTWDVATHAWKQQAGVFSVAVGASSRDIRATGTFTVKAAQA